MNLPSKLEYEMIAKRRAVLTYDGHTFAYVETPNWTCDTEEIAQEIVRRYNNAAPNPSQHQDP